MINTAPRKTPGLAPLRGYYTELVPFSDIKDMSPFLDTVIGRNNDGLWDYMSIGPFRDIAACEAGFLDVAAKGKWKVMFIRALNSEDILGTASFMRIRETQASAEIGFVLFNPALQKTRIATESIYLMIKTLFDDLGYRRVEWKCNNENIPSKKAAQRFGFSYEGLFRQDLIVKGKNRDTAWYSMIDKEWPRQKSRFETWLSPSNFDPQGQQRKPLERD